MWDGPQRLSPYALAISVSPTGFEPVTFGSGDAPAGVLRCPEAHISQYLTANRRALQGRAEDSIAVRETAEIPQVSGIARKMRGRTAEGTAGGGCPPLVVPAPSR